MIISKRQLRHMIREVMTSGPHATPGQAISTADDEKSGSGFSPEQKAAIGFMNNSMGPSPSADQLKGMGPELQSYAKDKDVDPEKMSNHLQQMLPATSAHPRFQYDGGSGAVGSTDGKKVYGENRMKITKRQIRRIVRSSLLESSRAGEAFDEGYSDATQERGLNPRRQGDMDYMQGFEMGEEDLQHEAEPAFRAPDPATHKRLRQQTRSQGGYSGRGAWKSRTPNK